MFQNLSLRSVFSLFFLALFVAAAFIGCAEKQNLGMNGVKGFDSRRPGQENTDTREKFKLTAKLSLNDLGRPVNRGILGVNLRRKFSLTEKKALSQKIKSLNLSSLRYLPLDEKAFSKADFLFLCKSLEISPAISPDSSAISLGDGYLPKLGAENPDPIETYWATMAGAEFMQKKMGALVQKLSKPQLTQTPFYLEQYGAFYSKGVERTDRLTDTPAGAVYVADLLRVLAQREDVSTAHYSSLVSATENDFLSLLTETGESRLAFNVLGLYSELLQGRFVPLELDSPSFSTVKLGAVPAFEKLPRVVGLATRNGDWVRVLFINKSMKMPADVTLNIGDFKLISTAAFNELSADGPWLNKPWYAVLGRLMSTEGDLVFRVEPHSVFLLKFAVTPDLTTEK